MNYIDLLNNEKVRESYNKVDEINPFPFNHGLKHVMNVCNIMDRLCDLLSIVGEEKEALLIATALHDVGQVDGREEHGRKSKEFLIKNFENELKDNKYYREILDAIENHNAVSDVDTPLFTLLVQFSDKVDFAKDRLEDDYKEKFGYCCWENIDRIDFIYDDNNFGIDIITSNVDNFGELFSQEKFSKKAINVVKTLAAKLDRDVVILNNGESLAANFDIGNSKTV